MFSDAIKAELEKEVVGQSVAVNTVVRGVTRLVSGLTPRERSVCAYMFMGPPGTGKTHLIQTLARLLHGDEDRVLVADCSDFVHGDPRMALVTQLAPLFSWSRMDGRWSNSPGVSEAPPLSIVQIEFLERGPKEVCKALASTLETGQLVFPDGRRGSLRNCIVFLTSGLCAREILDQAPAIGFAGLFDGDGEGEGEDDDGENRLQKLCYDQATEKFGSALVGRLDGFVVFHRLQEEHLARILDRRLERLDAYLARRGFHCEVEPAAREFLLEKGRRDLRWGARDLLRAHQKFVEFPVADLLVSGRIHAGGVVRVDHEPGEDHLHFTVDPRAAEAAPSPFVREIPVA